VISAAENSNKFQKTRFWKEKLVEDAVTLGPMAQATLVVYIKTTNACSGYSRIRSSAYSTSPTFNTMGIGIIQ
jgi:hypothetical protein